MAYTTKLQFIQNFERELDLEEEEFIQPLEMTKYINDGITVVEAIINTLGLKDQYLKTRTTVSLVQGTGDYSLPANLFENKIKEVVYSSGGEVYPMAPATGQDAAYCIELKRLYGNSDSYQYRVRNDASDKNYFQIIPVARETAANAIVIEYYRDLERVSADADLIEVPEIALQYLYKFCEVKIYKKESHVNYSQAAVDLKELLVLMVETLKGQLADDKDDVIVADMSAYEEMT